MGRRRTERQRQARKRRDSPQAPTEKRAATPTGPDEVTRRPWLLVTIAVALILFAGFTLISHFQHPRSGTPSSTQARGGTPASSAPIIDGIPCQFEDVTYHVHAFLEIYDRGHAIPVPANTGIVDDTCLYWLHTHDDSGEIHIEEPKQTRVTLGNFFDIWHQPLSRTQVATARTGFATSMRISVDLRPYNGNPRNIVLHPHELITIEVGPPWVAPSGFDFGSD